MSTSKRQGNLLALSGVFFAAFFIASLVLGGVLASAPLPLPDAPAADVVRFYEGNRVAALASSSLQALSAVSLYVFAACVAAFVRVTTSENGALVRLTLGGGILAAGFLLLSVLIQWVLALIVARGELTLVGTLRDLSFLAGGPAHVSLLGLFVGVASIATLRAKALPRWIPWLGIVAAVLSILSLASLVFFRLRSSSRSEGCSPSSGASPRGSCWSKADRVRQAGDVSRVEGARCWREPYKGRRAVVHRSIAWGKLARVGLN